MMNGRLIERIFFRTLYLVHSEYRKRKRKNRNDMKRDIVCKRFVLVGDTRRRVFRIRHDSRSCHSFLRANWPRLKKKKYIRIPRLSTTRYRYIPQLTSYIYRHINVNHELFGVFAHIEIIRYYYIIHLKLESIINIIFYYGVCNTIIIIIIETE